MLDRRFDDAPEVGVVVATLAHVAGVDAVLVERARAVGNLAEEQVPVVVEIAHQRRCDPRVVEAAADLRHRFGGLARVDGDAH